jgi:methylthioribose-1-phosphate isomerase
MSQSLPTLYWQGDIEGQLLLLDQTKLPGSIEYLECVDADQVWIAIQELSVRGAPAIGVAAAYGVCLGVQAALEGDREELVERARQVCDYLATSRPTAVNLFWALERMRRVANSDGPTDPREFANRLLAEALAIHEEDALMCAAIGQHGADWLASFPEGGGILTHCNAGALATGGEGTALAVIFELARRGRGPHVWIDETRPLLQGARLTAWELQQRAIDCTLICDNMAAQVMRTGQVQAIITGADRIAANGDTANKIGTYGLAVLAQAHNVPFFIAAPSSTFDRELASGDAIPIEQRPAREVTHGFGKRTAPEGIAVYNPAFDVTPAGLIAGIITERGVIASPDAESIARLIGG